MENEEDFHPYRNKEEKQFFKEENDKFFAECKRLTAKREKVSKEIHRLEKNGGSKAEISKLEKKEKKLIKEIKDLYLSHVDIAMQEAEIKAKHLGITSQEYRLREFNEITSSPCELTYIDMNNGKLLKTEWKYRCVNCGEKGFNKCSKCKQTYYCSTECQKADWSKHKKICKKYFPNILGKFNF